MKKRDDAIQTFWRWFQQHRADFDSLIDPDTAFWDAALEQLQRLNEHLWFELSEPDGTAREFIVTAEGRPDVFALADAVAAGAPQIPGWRFIALKPAMGFDFTTTYEGMRFEPSKMWFLPLDDNSRPQHLGLRVGIPNFNSARERETKTAVATILDTGLGERSAALDIQHVEVASLPEDPASKGYIELYELPKYIEWRKRKNREASIH